MAGAHGVRRVRKAFTNPVRRAVMTDALRGFLAKCGPGYSRAFEFVTSTKYKNGRNLMAELYHQAAIETGRKTGIKVWDSFPRAFHPFRTRDARVNFLCIAESPIAKRRPLSDRFFTYKQVVKQVEKLAQCTFIGFEGSHAQFRAPNGNKLTVPRHPGDLKPKTLASIASQLVSV